ncbi:cadherin-like beta sandwich domain-containing protein [Cohnella sp. GbtcB17]|uniref:cadherin-like beta sandwich domain-containing protein n=1 Tax=Cohnella sp. GbtcB17 TaxID=2824762 RepID=UPI001C2FFFF0|nr:cadherin-like beta sandwich domain-containing protein [Cohnella sp. GbtcB17]
MYRKLGMYLLAALLMLLPVAAAIGGKANAASSSRIAVIKQLSGDVQVQKAGGSKQFKAFAKLSLNQGDKLITGSKGSAVLQFANGTSEDDKFTVGENATLTFSKLSDKKGTVTKVSMLKGTAWVDVKSIKSKDDDFKLETPTAIMGVRGTAFFARVNPATGGTNTAVMSGVVRFTSENVENMGSGSGESAGGTGSSGSSKTIDLYPTQQISLEPTSGDDLREKTTLVDIEEIVKNAPPEVIEAILRSKEKIDEENRQTVDKFKQTGVPAELEQSLDKFAQNIEELLGVIAKQAIEQKKIDQQQLKKIEEQEKTSFDLDKDRLSQLNEKEKAKQEKAKLLAEEAAKRKAAEEAAKLKELADKINAAALKAIEAAKQAQDAANRQAAEAAKRKAEEELLKKLNEQQKQQYQTDKTNNQGGTTVTPGTNTSNLSSNANLGSLSIEGVTLSPSFNAAVAEYRASVASNKTSIVVGASVQDSGASFTINGQAPSGGQRTVSLAYGDNEIAVLVTAQNGATKSYKLTVTRQLLNNVSVVFPGQNGIDIDFNSTSAPAPLSIPSGSSNLTLVVPVTGPELDIAVNGQNVEPEPMFMAARTILPDQISWRYIIPLVQASNEIEIKATIDGVVKSYKLLANRSMPSDAAVQSVSAKSADGTASYEVSASGGNAWTVKVPADVTTIKLKINAINEAAKILLGTNEYASGAEISYTIINTTVQFKVRAADGTVPELFNSISIARLPSSDATLSDLTLSDGTLSPAFTRATTSYTASVGHAVDSITVTPTASNGNAAILVSDGITTSGKPSKPISLSVGTNQITVEVTAQNGARQKYTIIVTRETTALAAPAFNPSSGEVALGTQIEISSEAAEHIYYTMDGSDPATSVGGATKEYTKESKPTVEAAVTIKAIATRAGSQRSPISSATFTQAASADLTGLALSGSVSGFSFASGTYEYENVIVSSDTSNITVKAQGIGSITVNGEGVASGENSQAINLVVGEPRTITVVATEVGKTPKTYVIVVTRASNANANLASLSISSGTLSPIFESGITEYTTSVPYTVSSIRVTPTVAVGTSTVEVNGLATLSGNESENLPLNVGGNTVTVNVRSQSGFTRSYAINVTRQAASQDSTLSSLSIPDSALNPAFDSFTKKYKLSVPYATNGLFVYATASSPFATVIGTGPHALDVGENVIKVIVTAQDGATVSEYNITITRAQPPSSDTKLQSLSVSEGILEPEFSPSQHNYTVVVPHETDSIGITAVSNSPAASVEGGGQHALHVGSNNLPVTVTAEDDTTATYLIVVEREADPILSSIAGITSWNDTRSDDQDLTWHLGRDYRYEDILYAEVPDATVSVSSSITFDENVTSASLRKQYSEELIGRYEANGSQTMDIDYGALESGDNVFVLSIEEGEAGSNDYVIDLKAGQSRQALSMISARLEQGEGSLAVSHNDTYSFTLIMPSRNASFYLSLYPENVTGDLDIEGYGVEGGFLFVGASSLNDGWNEFTVRMKDIAGNAGVEDTVISVWRPSGEDEPGPESLSLALDAFAFENDGQIFYPESVDLFGYYNVAAQGTNADFSFIPSLADSTSLVESVYIVNNEDAHTELSPDGEGKYSFGMNLGDNVEIAVRDSQGHRFTHRIHINHTLQESNLPVGVLAWSVQDVEVSKGTYVHDNYYYASLSETIGDVSMNLVLDPMVYAGAALYPGTGVMARSNDPVASWDETEDADQLVSGVGSGYNSYTIELYPVDEEEGTTTYAVTIGNGPASIYGMSLWETFNGGDFSADAGWANTGTESSPIYQGYIYSSLGYLRFDMNFDENFVSNVSLEEIESSSPVEVEKSKNSGNYSFVMNDVPDGLRHLKLTVTELDGATTHEYDLFVHFDPQDNGVARVTSDITGMPVAWTRAEGVEEETNEGYVQRHYAIVAADKVGSALDWSIALQSESWMELQYEIVEASIDGDAELVDVDEFGLQARGGLALTHGYHDIRLKYKSFSPMSEEIAHYYIKEWIVFVGDSSQMANAPEAGLDGERVSLTKDEAHEYAPISMEWEGLSLTANVDNSTEGAILEAGGYSPYSQVEIEYLNERPNEITEGHYYLSNLNEGPNEVTIKVIDPTGTVEQSYTLVIYRAEKGGEVPPAPPARLSSLRIGSELVPIAEGQYEYTVYLPYGAPASMQVHAVALDQDRVELAVNDQPWAWDDDDEEHVLAPNEAGEYELEVSSADGSYATSIYHILVERLLTDDTRIDGDVPVSWSSGGQDTWTSEALELEEGDWLSMNFETPAGYHLYFRTDGTEFSAENQRWYLKSGINWLQVEVKKDGESDIIAAYQFNAYNWNSVLVTNKTDGTDPDRVQAIKWNGVYYAALPTYWFDNEAQPFVGIKTLHGLDEMSTVGWDFKESTYEGTLTHEDPAGHSIVRRVSVFAPAHMPAFEAQFQGGSFGWYYESYPRFFYGNDERPGAYFWTNDNTMIPTGVNLRVSQSEGDINIYAMDNDEQPFERNQLDGKWNWSLPLNWLESDGDVQTYKVVVENNGQTTVYLLSFGIGDSGTA